MAGLDGEERAVAAAGADGVHGWQHPVGAGPEVQVVDELVQAKRGQCADDSQRQQAHGGCLATADGTNRQPQ
jgi:hypothetical protein